MGTWTLSYLKYVDELLRSVRLPQANERELQEAIAELLDDTQITYKREVRLCDEDRIDFMLRAIAMEVVTDVDDPGEDHEIGVEVKLDGTLPQLIRQLDRYAQHDSVQGLLVVVARSRHLAIPKKLNGKPVKVTFLGAGAL